MIWSRVWRVNTLRSMLREYYPATLAAFDTRFAVAAAQVRPRRGRERGGRRGETCALGGRDHILPAGLYITQRVGKEMGSRALVADSKETWVCSYLSLTLLLGGWRVRGSRLVVGRSDWCAGDAPDILWQGWDGRR
jgi:hypothetical protein